MADGTDGAQDRPRVCVLGPVLVDDAAVAGLLPRRLIAALALAAPAVASGQRLIDDVWGDNAPESPRAALQTLVSRVRRLLGSAAIGSGPAGYRLTVGTDLDIARRATDPAALGRALALWRGDPGDDLGEAPVADSLRVQAETLRWSILKLRARTLIDEGRADEATDALTPLVDAAPLDEESAMLLMRAHAAAGRKVDALAVFARLRGALADALGTSPGAEVTELNARLLRDDGPQTRQIGLRSRRRRLVGRDDDIAAIEASVETHRLTTILGVGGLGKTSLAAEVARRSTTPVTIVAELAPATSPDDVMLTLATTIGIRTVSSVNRLSDPMVRTDLRSRVLTMLGERETLLVLDNCEHLVDSAAQLADDLLASVPTLRIVATSRAPLTIEGEQVYPLAPLAVTTDGTPGPAVELFLERARSVRPHAVLDTTSVGRICESLDGLPLAIELAAARVRSMSLDDIERRLRDRFALLTGVDRSAPARHRTLFAVIDWSWKLLEPRQRIVLRRLSVFADGFTADAAARVASNEDDVIDDLDALVAQSLVHVNDENGASRYSLLETVSEFARNRLDDAGERDEVGARYIAWLTDTALEVFERSAGPAQADALRVARAERENFIAALRQAISARRSDDVYALFAALGALWMMRGEHDELMAFGADVLAASDPRDIPEHVAEAAGFGLALIAVFFGIANVRHVTYPAVSRVRRLAGSGALSDARTLMILELFALPMPTTQSAIDTGLARLDELTHSRNHATAAFAATCAANVLENIGEGDAAIERARTALRHARLVDDAWLIGNIAQLLAQLYGETGRVHESARWAQTAHDQLAAIDAVHDDEYTEWVLALARIRSGESDAADAVTIPSEDDAQPEARSLLLSLHAEAALTRGDLTRAITIFEQALRILEPVGARSAPWSVLILSALVAAQAGAGTDQSAVARRLKTRLIVLARLRRWGVDQPVMGSGLAALGAVALRSETTAQGHGTDELELAQTGIELIALAETMSYRRDFSVLDLAGLLARARTQCGADAVAAARDRARALRPLERVSYARDLLGRLPRF